MNYQKIYSAFIADRRTREQTAQLLDMTEGHHILPRTLGGDDSPRNIIRLTPEDHFFAHLLLAKIHGGKMWYALRSMSWDPRGLRSQSEGYLRRRRKVYAIGRAGFSAMIKDRAAAGLLYVQTPEFRAENVARQKALGAAGLHSSQRPEVRAATSARMRAAAEEGRLWGQSPEGRKGIGAKMQAWWAANPPSAEWRADVSKRSKARADAGLLYVQTPEGRAMVSELGKRQRGVNSHRYDPTVHTLVDADGKEVSVTQMEMHTKLGLGKSLANMLVKGSVSVAKGWSVVGRERKTAVGAGNPRHRPEVREFRHVNGDIFVGTQMQFSDEKKVSRPAVSNLVTGKSQVRKGWYMAERGYPKLGPGSKWAKLVKA